MKFLIVFLFPFIIFAQTTNNLEFFPYQTGDMWEYSLRATDWPIDIDTLQSFMYYDSTDSHGNIYATKTNRYINPIVARDTIHYMIDTLNQVWGRIPEMEFGTNFKQVIVLKLNAVQGEKWVMKTDSLDENFFLYEMARVISISEQQIFGSVHAFMSTYYYTALDSTDTLSYLPDADLTKTFVKGFGLIWFGNSSYVMLPRLNGAVIDGVLYGDTTDVITSIIGNYNNLPTVFNLKQNYPNPFNPSTTIEYTLPVVETRNTLSVQLKIYDMIGEKVATLVNENQIPGNYSVNFDASNLSSGIYLYKLTVGNLFTESKKMILLK